MSPWLLGITGVVLAVLLVGLLADRLVAARQADRGGWWVRVLLLTAWPLALALLATLAVQQFAPGLWRTGWHPLADLLVPTDPYRHLLLLSLPLAWWVLALLLAAWLPAGSPAAGRWLAGAIGPTPSRAWVFWLAGVPLLLLAAVATPRLLAEPPAADYPVALWGLLLVTAVTLLGIGLSRGASRPSVPRPARTAAPPDWPDWPAALAAAGIRCEPLCQLPATGMPAGTADPALADLALAPDLVAALAAGGNRLLIAPADCGQVQTLAWLAGREATTGNRVTLVVCPGAPAALRAALLPLLPDPEAAVPLGPDTPADSPAWLWLTDARTLSDQWLPRFVADPALFARIGTVVWWDLQEYSGVLAANFWAITHRFDRLLAERRQAVRHIAWVRGQPAPETALTAFLNLCLPRRFPAEVQTVVPVAPVRPLALYLLDCASSAAPGLAGDPALAAARASVLAGWPTHLAAPAHLDAQTLAHFLAERPDGGAPLGARLLASPASAAARILTIDAADVLALPELIGQTARLAEGFPPLAQVAAEPAPGRRAQIGLITAFGNPYVASLLDRLREEPDLLTRRHRRMIAAEPQPGIVARHLLLALHELPGTRGELLRTFRQGPGGAVDRTLRALADGNQVQRREVRLLVEEDGQARLEVDTEYRSVLARDRAPPLTTVGHRLVDLHDPGAAVVLRLDPERLTIDAYPFRVFLHEGRRYRVRQWESVAAVTGEDGTWRLTCQREDFPVLTWRVFSPLLSETHSIDGRADVQILGRNLTRSLVSTVYAERVSGYLEYVQEPADGRWRLREQIGLPAMLRSPPMPTTGLLLHIPPAVGQGHPLGLHSVARALAHVCPVHLGVDADALAVLAFKDRPLDDRTGWGLMMVDLYPGGIGLVAAIDEEPALLVRLLTDARDWLARCPCQSEAGCPRCLQSPISRSAMADPITMAVSRSDALAVLERILRL